MEQIVHPPMEISVTSWKIQLEFPAEILIWIISQISVGLFNWQNQSEFPAESRTGLSS